MLGAYTASNLMPQCSCTRLAATIDTIDLYWLPYIYIYIAQIFGRGKP